LNIDELTREGSGYVGKHKKDFMPMNDSWSQWLNFKYDPSGSVFAIDWYDKNQCHSSNPDVHDKTMGRIFKISYETDKWVQADLRKATDLELVNYQLNPNEWYVRQARTILQERGGNKEVNDALKVILNTNPDISRKLRALWTLYVTNGLSEKELVDLLSNQSEYIRSWAIQFLAENKSVSSEALKHFGVMAKADKSALVRLYLASAMQRIEPNKRWEVVEALTQKTEDITDHNLPLMIWYAAEPLADIDVKRAIQMAEKSTMPKFLEYMKKRTGNNSTTDNRSHNHNH
jgi:hypothetical protein